MLKLGFSLVWVEKILRCIMSVRYSFSLNSDIIGNVIPSRGISKGDPLSPYLFVLCAHGISSMILSLEAYKLFTWVKIASSCPSLTHLFFAYDSFMFFRATMSEYMAIKYFLSLYEKASGQSINFEKSSLSFSLKTDAQMADNIKRTLTISVVHGHEVYLGLLVFFSRSKKLYFRYLVERIVRIKSWGHKTFSTGGK
ncbi:uncharacterized protein [Henckelia pumila]|uniref:uncharacterized protein n=1 Tax=Henckelia pumila TaxID=405737 RepID=UPI003C6DD8A3